MKAGPRQGSRSRLTHTQQPTRESTSVPVSAHEHPTDTRPEMESAEFDKAVAEQFARLTHAPEVLPRRRTLRSRAKSVVRQLLRAGGRS